MSRTSKVQETMQTCATKKEGFADVGEEIGHYRAILRQRTRYYLAQRDAGVPPVGAAILDLVILGNLEGCFINIEALAEVLDIARGAARERVVELIREGWIEVRQTASGAGLHATEKAAECAEHWIGIARAA